MYYLPDFPRLHQLCDFSNLGRTRTTAKLRLYFSATSDLANTKIDLDTNSFKLLQTFALQFCINLKKENEQDFSNRCFGSNGYRGN